MQPLSPSHSQSPVAAPVITATPDGSIRQKDIKRLLADSTPLLRQPLASYDIAPVATSTLLHSHHQDDPEQSLMYVTARTGLLQNELEQINQSLPGHESLQEEEPMEVESHPLEQATASQTMPYTIDVESALGPGLLTHGLPMEQDMEDDEGEQFFSVTSTLMQPLDSLPLNSLPVDALPHAALQAVADILQEQLAAGQDPLNSAELKQAMHTWLSHYPAVTAPEQMIETLCSSCRGMTDPEQITRSFSGSIRIFEVAGVLTAEAPEQVFEHLGDPGQALQALLIFRHYLVSNTPDEAYLQTVEKLDALIGQTLTQQLAQPLEQALGLDIDPQQPDYARYRKLTELAGHPQPVTALEEGIVAHAARHPDSLLATLLKLDNWLASDEEAPNMVTWCLGGALLQPLQTVVAQLQPASPQSQQPKAEAASPSTAPHHSGSKDPARRVRFSSQPDVIPREAKHTDQAPVEDIVPLSRPDMASHLSRQYFDKLGDTLRQMETQANQGDENSDQALQHIRNLAEISRQDHAKIIELLHSPPPQGVRALQSRNRKIQALDQQVRSCKQSLLTFADTLMTSCYSTDTDLLSPQGRARKLAELSFIKSGLVNKEQFLETYEQYITDLIIQNLLPRLSNAHGQAINHYEDLRDQKILWQKEDPAREPPTYQEPFLKATTHLRGYPKTSDLMQGLSATTRPFHQAMEVNLHDPLAFCRDLMVVDDLQVMIALRVRMEQENIADIRLANWQERMKEVVQQHCFQRIGMTIDYAIGKAIRKIITDEQHKPSKDKTFQGQEPDLSNPEELEQVEAITRSVCNRYLSFFDKKPMTDWIQANGYDHDIGKIWASGLNKPAGWPDDLSRFIEPCLPSAREIADTLRAQGLGTSS